MGIIFSEMKEFFKKILIPVPKMGALILSSLLKEPSFIFYSIEDCNLKVDSLIKWACKSNDLLWRTHGVPWLLKNLNTLQAQKEKETLLIFFATIVH